jgi:hypothetical protein
METADVVVPGRPPRRRLGRSTSRPKIRRGGVVLGVALARGRRDPGGLPGRSWDAPAGGNSGERGLSAFSSSPFADPARTTGEPQRPGTRSTRPGSSCVPASVGVLVGSTGAGARPRGGAERAGASSSGSDAASAEFGAEGRGASRAPRGCLAGSRLPGHRSELGGGGLSRADCVSGSPSPPGRPGPIDGVGRKPSPRTPRKLRRSTGEAHITGSRWTVGGTDGEARSDTGRDRPGPAGQGRHVRTGGRRRGIPRGGSPDRVGTPPRRGASLASRRRGGRPDRSPRRGRTRATPATPNGGREFSSRAGPDGPSQLDSGRAAIREEIARPAYRRTEGSAFPTSRESVDSSPHRALVARGAPRLTPDDAPPTGASRWAGPAAGGARGSRPFAGGPARLRSALAR